MLDEAAIRTALRPLAVASQSANDPVGVIEEFWLPKSNIRADLAVVGAGLHGFEIKSPRDSLRRLPGQIEAFGRVFDTCVAVLDEKHLAQALPVLPAWWGVVQVQEREPDVPYVSVIRASKPNPAIDLDSLVRLLWKAEAAQALRSTGHEPDPRAGRVHLWEQLLADAEPPAIAQAVHAALRNRTTWRGQQGRSRLTLSQPAVL